MMDLSTDLREQGHERPVRSRRSLLALTGFGAAGAAALAMSSSAAAAPAPSADSDDPNVLNVRDFGATGDGVTDDLAAINAALAAAAALVVVPKLAGTGLAPTVVFPAAVGYRVTGTVTVPPRVAVVMHASVLYDGPIDAPGLVVGSTASPTMGLTFKLDISRVDGPGYADWSSDEHVGIRLVNFDECVVWAMRSQGFGIGLQCLGDHGGFAYNEIHLGMILDARVGVDLTNVNRGWCNENIYLNGRISEFTALNAETPRIGIRFTSMDGAYTGNNNNLFLKPSVEIGKSSADPKPESLCVLIEDGVMNRIISLRTDGNTLPAVRVLNACYSNLVEIGYGSGGGQHLDDQSLYPNNVVRQPLTRGVECPTTVFSSGSLAQSAVPYDDHQISIPRVGFSPPDSSEVAAAGAMTLRPDTVEVSTDSDSGLGVFVDTTSVKRLVVKQDAQPSFAGRIHIVCYDANGAILADDGQSPLLRTSRFMTAAWMPGLFGGCYQATRDEPSTQWDNGFLAVLADEVAAIRVVFWKGTHAMRLRGFSIIAQDSGAPAVWSGLPGPVGPSGAAVKPPTSGVWPKGTFIPNAKMTLQRGRYAVTGWLKVSDADTNRPGDDWQELRSECQIPGRA